MSSDYFAILQITSLVIENKRLSLESSVAFTIIIAFYLIAEHNSM
jgi:hypothetical protein